MEGVPDSTDRLPDALAPEWRRLFLVAVVATLVGVAGTQLLTPEPPPVSADTPDTTTVSADVLDARTPTPVSPSATAATVGGTDTPLPTVATLSPTQTRRPTVTATATATPTTATPASSTTPPPRFTPSTTPPPRSTSSATPTPDRGPGVVILTIQADAPGTERENLGREFVVFHNPGRRPLQVGNWTVADADGHRYRFPSRAVVAGGETVTLHTGRGRDGPRHRYWNRSTPVWNNGGDVVIVRDADGDVRARQAYGDATSQGVEFFGRGDVRERVDPDVARERMVARLQRLDRVERPETVTALRSVPRHEFLPDESVAAAYADRPRPIDAGQTISAPHAVAWITDLLGLSAGDRVLEIGTGCGYHAAVTAAVVDRGSVYSVEYREELARAARERFDRVGRDVRVRVGDGHEGWAEHAPYDAAYLTCAPPVVPQAVIDQVRPGGRVVAPVGTGSQQLVRLHVESGGVRREEHGDVRFVTMAGDE